MTPGQTYLQFTDGLNVPTQFRVVVVLERVRRENPATFQNEEQNIYCAMAMEWNNCASGASIEQAVQRLEYCLFAQASLRLEFPASTPMGPAHEDWQRVATSGDDYISSDKEWFAVTGPLPIVHRCVIDMTKSELRLVDAKKEV